MTIKQEFILKKFGDQKKGADEGIEKAILETVAEIATQAKQLAPVDTGQLRNSITFTTSSWLGDLTVRPLKNEGYVGSPLDYAVYQEFGTRRMAPQPWLRPAVALVAGKNKKDVEKAMNEAMKKWSKGKVSVTKF